MAARAASQIVSGTKKVTTAQTAERLTSTPLAHRIIGVWVCADPNNTGKAAVGASNVNAKATLGTTIGITLETKQPPLFIEIDDPTQLFVDVSVSGEAVTWTALLA